MRLPGLLLTRAFARGLARLRRGPGPATLPREAQVTAAALVMLARWGCWCWA